MKVTHDNINTFLYTPGKYFVIPDFQRPYSWDKANITSFIEDLETVLAGNKTHYFGSIVYINEGNNSTIIDGQQRATTVLLMLTAIYHIITDTPGASTIPAQAIKDQYLYNSQDYNQEKNRIKLRTVTADNTIFEQIFERKEFTTNSKDSKLYQAYAQFYDYFKERVDLHKYVDILKNFEVVTIALDASDDNPQKIFESINSTGKPLTDGDKIRNFALMLNNDKTREIVLKNYWETIEKKLTDINKDFISDFFKYYLTSKLQKEVKIENVYPEFKTLFNKSIGNDQDDVIKLQIFYDEVLAYLAHYVFLKFNSDEKETYKVVSDRGFRLNYLKIETPYPFLMRVLDEYKRNKINDKELENIFIIIESFLTRRIICNIATTGLNNLFSALHKDIENYKSEIPDASYSKILEFILVNKSGAVRMPAEGEIKNAVKNNPVYAQRTYYKNFILSSIDDQSKESALLKQIASGDLELTIEHIMPQTLNKTWIQVLGENYEQIHNQYLHTLPNLTLTGYNSKYSNQDFSFKKQIEHGFNDSPLLINQFIKNFDVWDLAALEKREQWWFEQIEKIWPLPKPAFQPKDTKTEVTFYDDIDLTGTKVKGVTILGEFTACNSWIAVLETILYKFFMLEEKLYDYVTSDTYLHKYITANQESLRNPKKIEGTNVYIENNTNTNRKRDVIVKLAEFLELDKSDIKVVLENQ